MHTIEDVAASVLDHVPTTQLMHTATLVAMLTDDHIPVLHAMQALPENHKPVPQLLEHAAAEVLP